jgi:hypothetical protein
MNQALFLIDPGTSDANSDNTVFDGTNLSGNRVEWPSHDIDKDYDDRVFGMGFMQLSAQLSCPELFAKVNDAGSCCGGGIGYKWAYPIL